jgi:methylated-DNA-[protein]-cysteine S-methyltransferase
MAILYRVVDSPVGGLRLAASEKGLTAITWHDAGANGEDRSPVCETLQQAERELHEYFAGQRRVFSIPLDMQGTEFQLAVWRALLEIPFGTTRSYGQLASRLGNPQAYRAVGAANGRNPIPIVVPCHRVIGSTGKLTGFGGGLPTKEFLLRLEASQRRLL